MARGPRDQQGALTEAAQRAMGLRPGTQFYGPYPFAGMNTVSNPVAVDDREFPYIENFLRLGDGKLRTAWDVGSPLYAATAGLNIVMFYPYTLGVNYYFAVFLSDGSARQVAWPSGATTVIGGAGTFFNASGQLPACSQWGVIYLLISNRNTSNDYWIWDGINLYKTGGAAPNGVNILATGSNYDTNPTLTVYGGLGSGMQLTPVVNAGGVVEIIINNPGVGYNVGDFVQIAFSGGGSDTSAILTASVNTTGVAAANVTSPGTGYTSPPTVAFSGGGGTGAAGTAIVGAGVSSVTITAPGSGYTGANVSFSGGGGSGAAATATVNGGQVVDITVTDPGIGYTSAPTVNIAGDGTGATATAAVNSGEVVGITITAPGSGYTSAPSIALTGGGGTGATATAILASGSVQGVTVTNPGSGFTTPPLLSFIGGGAPTTVATASTYLTATSISKINLTSGGQNYGNVDGSVPGVEILGGKGTGAKATADTADGAVINVTLTNGGSGYQLQPLIGFKNFGKNTGSGATAQAVLSPTTIDHVTMANYGANYTSAPAVQVQPGGNNSASASISLMPFGVSGAAIETFQNRVWIFNPAQGPFSTVPPQGNFVVTAPGSVTDIATSAGGLVFTNTDRFLQTRYIAARQSNGYLYLFGDGSISVVSNVQVSTDQTTGSVSTSFNDQNIDPQIGADWRDSLQDFSKTILFGNKTGVYGLYGGAATKVSPKLDELFYESFVGAIPSGSVTPTGAVAHLFGIKHYLFLMTIADPDTGAPHTVMATWNEREWVLTSQGVNLVYIAGQKVGSLYTAWGTDGTSLYPLFQTPSASLTKRLYTKLYGVPKSQIIKDLTALYIQAQDKSSDAEGVSITLEFDVSGLAVQAEPFGVSAPSTVVSAGSIEMTEPTFASPSPAWGVWAAGTGGLPFITVGARLTTTSPDFELANLLLSYTETTAVGA